MRGLKFTNVDTQVLWRWNWDINLLDLDGSLTGYPGASAVSAENITLSDPNCHIKPKFTNGIACERTEWIRFAFNNLNPNLVLLVNITKEPDNLMISSPWLKKRLTYQQGFMFGLEANQRYTMRLDQAPRPTNVSFDGTFWDFKSGQYIIMQLEMKKKPDVVNFGSVSSIQSPTPILPSSTPGSWYWENSTSTLSFILGNFNNTLPFLDIPVSFTAYVCRYLNCKAPISPSNLLPITARPANALYWSNITTWQTIALSGGYVYTNTIGGVVTVRAPVDLDDVKIPSGIYVVVDTQLPTIRHLEIEGYLELDNNISHNLECNVLLIDGGQLIVGWENDPILTDVTISLTGNKTDASSYFLQDGATSIGYKSIGVFGGIDIHGRARNVSWTTLSSNAFVGSNQIKLANSVDWQIGEEIILTTTSYTATETEVFKIQAVSADRLTLTLNGSLLYNHVSFEETLVTGKTLRIAGAVGLLTRNVKVIGAEYVGQESDLYGVTVIVSDYSTLNADGLPMFYKGYARLSNVEFIHPGQFYRGSSDDATYGIIISNLGAYNYSRPTYIRSCSFHHGYSAAIGILGSNSIPIENNVFYR